MIHARAEKAEVTCTYMENALVAPLPTSFPNSLPDCYLGHHSRFAVLEKGTKATREVRVLPRSLALGKAFLERESSAQAGEVRCALGGQQLQG